MPTPEPNDLRVYFPSKELGSDGAALTAFSVTTGTDTQNFVDNVNTQADGYFDGAIGWFTNTTTTVALRNQFFHVKTYASNNFLLARPLPATPAIGDTFRIIIGGNYRSSTEVFGMMLDGGFPEQSSVAGVNITGLSIKYASTGLGEGTLTVDFNQSAMEMAISSPNGGFGPVLDVSSNVTDGFIFIGGGLGYIKVDVVTASLPGSDQQDTYAATYQLQAFTPNYEGYETENAYKGKSRYRLQVIKNTSADTMVDLSAYLNSSGFETAISTGESCGTGADDFLVDDASGFPTKSFWVKNKTKNDCRYIPYRSGARLYASAVTWGTLTFNNGSSEIFQNDEIRDDTTLATAFVDQIVVSSGTWGGGDAAGTIIFKGIEGGSFNTTNAISVIGGGGSAQVNAGSALGFRGYTGVAWAATDEIVILPHVDIGIDAPSANQFENPSTEILAPSGVTFTSPLDKATGQSIGNLATTAIYGVWQREVIVDGHQSRDDVIADIVYSWS